MEISGEVTSIIYRNETNGYTVAEIDYKKSSYFYNSRFFGFCEQREKFFKISG